MCHQSVVNLIKSIVLASPITVVVVVVVFVVVVTVINVVVVIVVFVVAVVNGVLFAVIVVDIVAVVIVQCCYSNSECSNDSIAVEITIAVVFFSVIGLVGVVVNLVSILVL